METIDVNALKAKFYRNYYSSYKTFVDNYKITSKELIHFLKEWGDSQYLIKLSTEDKGDTELYKLFCNNNPDDVVFAEKRQLRPSMLFDALNAIYNALPDRYKGKEDGQYRNAIDYFYKQFSCSQDCKDNLRKYSYMEGLCRLQLRNEIDIEDMQVSVEEFFSIIAGNNDYLNYISAIIEFNGRNQKVFRYILNEDRIVRDIVSYFWEQLSGVSKKEYIKGKGSKVYGKTVRIIEILNNLLNSESKKWYDAANLLRIKNHLRNATGHRLNSYFKDDTDRICTENILFTLIYTVLALRSSLKEKGEIEDFEWPLRELQVYCKPCDGLIDIELYKRGYDNKDDVSVNCKSESGGFRTYLLNRADDYYLKYKGVFKVPEDIVMGITPIAIWNGTEFKFSPDLYSIQPEVVNAIEGTVIDELNKHAQNIDNEIICLTEAFFAGISDLNKNVEEGFHEVSVAIDKQTEEQKKIFREILETILKQHEAEETEKKAEDEARKKTIRKCKRNIGIAIACLMVLLCVGLLLYRSSPTKSPEMVIVKGDQYLRDNDPEKAGETYRKAISMYRDTLAKDSNNVKANIGLAMMLMRGKGEYNLSEAERCAKRVYATDEINARGEGLYHYLLMRNGKYEEVDKLIKNMRADGTKDSYTKLTESVLDIYGFCGRERNEEKVMVARQTIDSLCFYSQEAILERAEMVVYGIENGSMEDSYYIWPDPIFAENELYVLAIDSLNPEAMVRLSDFYGQLGELKKSLDFGVSAYECGMKNYAPFLTILILQNIDLRNSDKEINSLFDRIARTAVKDNTLSAKCSNYFTRIYNYYFNKFSAEDLLKSTDDLINCIVDSNDDHYQSVLEQLYRIRVTLCMETGDLKKATSLAMKIDNCSDSIAVGEYLEGICCDRGYSGYPQDSILRDSLISSSAEKGYVEAVFTRLKKADRLRCYPVRSNHKDHIFKYSTGECVFVADVYKKFGNKGVFLNSFKRNDNQCAKPIFELNYITPVIPKVQPKTNTKKEGPFTLAGEEAAEVSVYIDKSFFKEYQYVVGIHYDASSYAQVNDSVWSKSPKLAVELADYWRDYLMNCPKEYQVVWNVLSNCYNYFELSNGEGFLRTMDLINKPIVEDYFAEIKVGIASALKHGNGEMAKHLITMWLTLSSEHEVDKTEKSHYEQFALPEYEEKGFLPYKKIDYPLYAY